MLQCRLQEPLTKAWIPLLETQINDLNLPNIAALLQNTPSKSTWKKCVTKILVTQAHLHLLNQAETKCDLELLSMCAPNFSSSPLWKVTHCLDWSHLTSKSNFRIRLLGCHGLESDASRFSVRKDGQSHGDPSCKLCGAALEDATHFISSCTMLEAKRRELLSYAPLQSTYRTPHVSQIVSPVSCWESTGLMISKSKFCETACAVLEQCWVCVVCWSLSYAVKILLLLDVADMDRLLCV